MHRFLLALIMASILPLATSIPASAQTWVQLRYWSTNATVNNAGATFPFTSGLYGASLRHTFMGGTWALSLNYDHGTIPVTGVLPFTTSGMFNQFWNANIHYNLPIPTGALSVFAGYGYAALELPNFPGGLFSRQSAFRIGVDGRVNLQSNWYLTGSFGYMPGGTAQQQNFFVVGPASVSANLSDLQVGLGYSMGGYGIEAGYRTVNWNFTPGAGSCPGAPCFANWNGWYVGVNFTTP